MHINPLIHEGLVPFFSEWMVHHVAIDRPHGDELVSAIAKGGVSGLYSAHQGRHDVRSLLPTVEHLHTIADQLCGVTTYLLDRLAKGEDVIDACLGDGGRLREGEQVVQKVSTPSSFKMLNALRPFTEQGTLRMI